MRGKRKSTEQEYEFAIDQAIMAGLFIGGFIVYVIFTSGVLDLGWDRALELFLRKLQPGLRGL